MYVSSSQSFHSSLGLGFHSSACTLEICLCPFTVRRLLVCSRNATSSSLKFLPRASREKLYINIVLLLTIQAPLWIIRADMTLVDVS